MTKRVGVIAIDPAAILLDSRTFDKAFLVAVRKNPVNGIEQGEFTVGQFLKRLRQDHAGGGRSTGP